MYPLHLHTPRRRSHPPPLSLRQKEHKGRPPRAPLFHKIGTWVRPGRSTRVKSGTSGEWIASQIGSLEITLPGEVRSVSATISSRTWQAEPMARQTKGIGISACC